MSWVLLIWERLWDYFIVRIRPQVLCPFLFLSPPARDKDKDEGAVGALRAWQVGQVPHEAMWTQ